MRTLDGKVMVITGAASGIGRALAIQAAGHGARLALSDVDDRGLAETARLVSAAPGRAVRTDHLDVSDRAAVAAYAASVAAEFGTVNVLVNNAGVALTGTLTESSYADLDWIMGIDFWGVVHGSKEFLPHLIASGDGQLVNISSLFGLMAVATQGAYNAAKFAVRGLTESLRMEMIEAGHPVGVTSVHPGGVKTAVARNARVAGDRDQAELAAYFDAKLARTTPEQAASLIIAGILKNKARVIIGKDARVLDVLVRVLGGHYVGLLARATKRTVPKPRPIDAQRTAGPARESA